GFLKYTIFLDITHSFHYYEKSFLFIINAKKILVLRSFTK
ncbi:MAG: CRISPR-associated DxTHG motif protein, partial [Lachnospiraceae bacterium]|nr:CRISPR-associated DxTHG motif protein [Lachnospiraceae bacterium]